MWRFTRRQRHRGTSLIEILVVVAILAVLLGFLIPALRGARERSRQIQCAGNLRNIHRALLSYAADFDGWLPRGSYGLNRNGTSFAVLAAKRLGFPDANYNTLNVIPVLACPAHPRGEEIPTGYLSNAFAFIDDQARPGDYITLRSQIGGIRNPAGAIYLTEIIDSDQPPERREWETVPDVLGHQVYYLWEIRSSGWPRRVAPYRHGKRVNALMFDGSVASLAGEQHEAKRYDDGRRGLPGRSLRDVRFLNPLPEKKS